MMVRYAPKLTLNKVFYNKYHVQKFKNLPYYIEKIKNKSTLDYWADFFADLICKSNIWSKFCLWLFKST